mmetsp:Transcript_53002/g.158641  ORF Transcript_53002/g.158641 Transcript_53002/m.158641 type:complete len:205 (+) Transcript_53002:319-933(+)
MNPPCACCSSIVCMLSNSSFSPRPPPARKSSSATSSTRQWSAVILPIPPESPPIAMPLTLPASSKNSAYPVAIPQITASSISAAYVMAASMRTYPIVACIACVTTLRAFRRFPGPIHLRTPLLSADRPSFMAASINTNRAPNTNLAGESSVHVSKNRLRHGMEPSPEARTKRKPDIYMAVEPVQKGGAAKVVEAAATTSSDMGG